MAVASADGGGANWVEAIKNFAAEALKSSEQLPPLPDTSGLTQQEKAVLLFTRGLTAAEAGEAGTAEAMVRYALKISPELAAPLKDWQSWAKEAARHVVRLQLAQYPEPEEGEQQPAAEQPGGRGATTAVPAADTEAEEAAGRRPAAGAAAAPAGGAIEGVEEESTVSGLEMFLIGCLVVAVAGAVFARSGRRRPA
mmetsp:Transcript_80673/g.218775  ORF Transcript_80673/g.218775 Transcript_80673/m.218775 type:complete len:196 (-) Transcript_80673:7-594(-)